MFGENLNNVVLDVRALPTHTSSGDPEPLIPLIGTQRVLVLPTRPENDTPLLPCYYRHFPITREPPIAYGCQNRVSSSSKPIRHGCHLDNPQQRVSANADRKLEQNFPRGQCLMKYR